MKITAKLAYSQLKEQRSRTIWTLLVIALSTALTVAVSSFVVSGNQMIKGFLGENYGEYGKSYEAMLRVPAVIFGLLIMGMSITVITNVFRISAQDRMNQFGILKCVGATGKQIKQTVMYESIFLCIVGIPAGICLGLLLAFIGIRATNSFLDDFNALVRIMVTKITLSLDFVFSIKAVLLSAVFSFLTVMYSAWRPAHKAAKVSAIDSIQGRGEIKVKEKSLHDNPFVKKFFGFEGVLADRNIKRNRRNFRATVVSLSVGVILFVSLGGLRSIAKGMEDFMTPETEHNTVVEYSSDYDGQTNTKTGREARISRHPIDGKCGENIKKILEKYDTDEILGTGSDMDTYAVTLPKSLVTSDMQKAVKEQKTQYTLPVEILVMDDKNYEKMCKDAGIEPGGYILLNHYWYNDSGYKKDIEPFSSELKQLELEKADGSKDTVKVDGMLTKEQIPKDLFGPGVHPVRLVVKDAKVRMYSWYVSPKKEDGFREYAEKEIKKAFPAKSGGESSYEIDGFRTRVYRVDDYMKVLNIAISLAVVLIYSFTFLLMLIGLTNVISTLSTNVRMRSREFAVLKSVGMTTESLKKMLNFESILCSLKALLIGLPVGIGITILVNNPVRELYPIPYELPYMSILFSILAVFLITLVTTRYAAYRLRNQNIIESIRAESGK